MENRLPRRTTLGQQVPVAASFGDVQQSVHDEPKRSSWAIRLSWLGQHLFERHPLSVRRVGGEICISHRLESLCRGDVAPFKPCRKSVSKYRTMLYSLGFLRVCKARVFRRALGSSRYRWLKYGWEHLP